MAHAVAIAAEPAAEAAQQINDHNDDQDQTKRHGTLLRPARQRGALIRLPPTKESTIRPLVPRGNRLAERNRRSHPALPRFLSLFSREGGKGPPDRYFGCSFSAAELMQ